jgi:hypothetical protein
MRIMKTTTLPLKHSRNRSPLRAILLIPFLLVCFASSRQARATCQQGCLSADNTALGDDALVNNTIGGYNTAVGFNALLSNTLGNYNTATGYQALLDNTLGILNTATGSLALHENTTGIGNVATGAAALLHNVAGSGNTATGVATLELNQGNDNTATGGGALTGNQTGNNNTATGNLALEINFSGSSNTATGSLALQNNELGSNNTADGANVLIETSGSNNIALGANAGVNLTTGDNNIDIGNAGVAGESSKIRIGTEGTHTATYIAGIRQAPLVHGTALAVGITADGQLGVRASSARFKEAIKPMDKASEAILALKPVTFRYKKDLDPNCIPQFGLVAEDVEKVNPTLVARDEQGKPYTVHYEAVNAMLLNEFLKEHQTVQDLRATVAQQQKQIDALTAGLLKVSAQVELSKSAPQMANN